MSVYTPAKWADGSFLCTVTLKSVLHDEIGPNPFGRDASDALIIFVALVVGLDEVGRGLAAASERLQGLLV